jgi:opine dehydrogenase
MRIAETLTSELVFVKIKAKERVETIDLLLSELHKIRGVDKETALRDLAANGQAATLRVAVGDNYLAVPHAVTQASKQLVMAVATSPAGILWGEGPDELANVVILLLGPPQTHGLYLRVLSRIARFCKTEGFLPSLLDAQSSLDLIGYLESAESSMEEVAEEPDSPRFCVIGAGPGGMAMAGHLALMGRKVNLYTRNADRLAPVQARGGIDVTGEIQGLAKLDVVTTDPEKAVEHSEVLMIVVPATAHRNIAKIIAPYIKDGQIIVLNPGRTGGALEFAQVLQTVNPVVRPYLAEAQTLLYASRLTNPGQVHIYGIKNSVALAALPAYQTADILPIIRTALPQFVPGDNVLKTGLDNIGAVFHPAITLLNSARIENTNGNFQFYLEGVTPAVASILEAIDQERVAVAEALGIRANTAREWLYLAYNAAGKTLIEAMRANPGYRGINAPSTVHHRYISEDVPASLVPIASIGEMLGVRTPAMRSIIHLASVMHGIDYWAIGRTVDKLGIAGMSVKEIRFLVVGAEMKGPEQKAGNQQAIDYTALVGFGKYGFDGGT